MKFAEVHKRVFKEANEIDFHSFSDMFAFLKDHREMQEHPVEVTVRSKFMEAALKYAKVEFSLVKMSIFLSGGEYVAYSAKYVRSAKFLKTGNSSYRLNILCMDGGTILIDWPHVSIK